MKRPFSLCILGQDFYIDHPHVVFLPEEIRSAPRPRVAIISTADDWYQFDRSDMDLIVYWTSESLGVERAQGKRIVPLSDKDRIYSSCLGPDSNSNLHFWTAACANVYNPNNGKFKKLLPNLEIKKHAMLSTLGVARLPRSYAYLQMLDLGLDKGNMISLVDRNFQWGMQPDAEEELPGQDRMSRYVRKNFSRMPQSPLRLELDWRRLKSLTYFHDLNVGGILDAMIIPTKAFNACSFLYVMETLLYNPEFFLTEKTGKALLSGRAWTIVGCRYYLERLKELGFMTMEGIIDESYDAIYNVDERINGSLLAAKQFMDKDVLSDQGLLSAIMDISLHNRKIMFNTDWETNIKKASQELINEINSIDINGKL